ncbi:MAG TPA: hypothetical protein VK579_04060 [Terriglobales bacterium]|jgi:hypothetical protein|nr:hypothetical protein [Terriglobales bacterium]
MNEAPNALEGLKLISDWGKWLITIQTAAIAVIGAGVREGGVEMTGTAKVLATGSVACFVASVAAAALLLLSLPDITQNLRPDTNIWRTRGTLIGRVFHLDTRSLATLESLFFGLGVVCFAGLIVAAIWSR